MKRVRSGSGGPGRKGWDGSETFHRYTFCSPVRTARVRPFGEKARVSAPLPLMNGGPSRTGRPGCATFHSRSRPSRAVVASTRPLGLNAPERPIMSEVGIDHRRTLASPLPVARVRPSGLKPSAYISPLLPASGSPICEGEFGSLTFHRLAVLSALAAARRPPSGLNATDQTGPVCPVRGAPSGFAAAGSAMSHSRTVSSALPLARVCPSGLNATECTMSVWPRSTPSEAGRRGSVTFHSRIM
ncbi:hypothetical protein GA0115258_10991, partial [Streptomyces sp. LamerLS-31b]